MKTFLLIGALVCASGVAQADTVYGEHSWHGTMQDADYKLLRVATGNHKVVSKGNTAIICAVSAPTGGVLSASHAAAGQECIVSWKTGETATFTYVVFFDTDRAVADDYTHPTTYTAAFAK